MMGPAGATGPGSAGYVIFRPGVPSAGQHVATPAELTTAIANGAATIYVDSSLAAAQLPAAFVLQLSSFVKLESFNQQALGAGAFDLLEVLNTATIANLRYIGTGLVVQCDCVTTPALTFSQVKPEVVIDGGALTLGPGATVPAYKVANGVTLFISQLNLAAVEGQVAAVCIGTALGGTLAVALFDESQIVSSSYGSDSGSTLAIRYEDSSLLPDLTTIPAFAGTLITGSLSNDQQQNYGEGTAFPTVNLTIGQPFFRTDLNATFRWNGAVWVSPGTVGRAFTPAGTTLYSAAYAPTNAPTKALAAVDITTSQSGIVEFNGVLNIISSDLTDVPLLLLYVVFLGTAVAGGTDVSAGPPASQPIWALPTSTTPAFLGGDISGASQGDVDHATGAVTLAVHATIPAAPVNSRMFLVLVGVSTSGVATWQVSGKLSAFEQPN